MLSSVEIAKLEKLIAKGRSIRQVRDDAQVGIGTVHRIKTGYTTSAKRRKRELERRKRIISNLEQKHADEEFELVAEYRCRECGAKITTRKCVRCSR